VGSQKRVAKIKETEELEEDSMSEEGRDGCRKGWLIKFSTIK